ncbi:MAG: MerR family transcriptional regulator [Desulfobacterales bacterium]|nr:MerR family transcriptional regulator [Desulfobacterales bacterium]
MISLSIKQVSKITDTPPHTLRFWEKEFDGILIPDRTKGGQRRYNQESISLIERIKLSKNQGLSLSMIRHKLCQNHEDQNDHFHTVDFLAEKVSKIVRDEIYNFFQNKHNAIKN